MSQPPDLEALLADLRDGDTPVWQQAALALVEIGGPAIPSLIEALGEQDDDLRNNAAWILGQIGDPVAIPDLLRALRTDEYDAVRGTAASALSKIGDPVAIPDLIAALRDQEEHVRMNAAWALGDFGDPAAIPGLVQILHDPAREVSMCAINVLGTIGDPVAIPDLLEILHGDNGILRRNAATALGWIGDPTVVPELIACLSDTEKPPWDDKRVCDMAAWALKRIGTPEALAAVAQWRGEPGAES